MSRCGIVENKCFRRVTKAADRARFAWKCTERLRRESRHGSRPHAHVRSMVTSTIANGIPLVVDDLADTIEDLFVVWLHLNRVGTLAQHEQEYRVRDEVKAGEPRSLLFQVPLKALLTLLQFNVEHRECAAECFA